jgi:glycerol-3-phosphate acyltransferase PlsY
MASALIVIAAYLIGSVSFAVVMSRMFNCLTHTNTAGESGATNVLRTGNVPRCLPCWAMRQGLWPFSRNTSRRQPAPRVDGTAAALAGSSAICTRCSQVRRRQGVATAAGIISYIGRLTGACHRLTLAFGFKISSVAALVTAVVLLLGMFYVWRFTIAWAMVPIAALLFWRHRTNIRELLAGRERTIGR